jgi:hypothetical protein
MNSDATLQADAEKISAIEQLNGSVRPIAPSPQLSAEAFEVQRTLQMLAKFGDKLRLAQHEIGIVIARGSHAQGYRYAQDEDIIDAANQAAYAAKLAIVVTPAQHIATDKGATASGKGAIVEGIVDVDLVLIDCETGFKFSMGRHRGVMKDSGGDGALTKALTVAKKNALKTAFNIAVSDERQPTTDKTLPLSDEKGSVGPAQITRIESAIAHLVGTIGKEQAKAECVKILQELNAEKFHELSERNSVDALRKLKAIADTFTRKQRSAAAS